MYDFIRVKICSGDEFVGCLHFFNEYQLEKRLKDEIYFLEKEYNNIRYEILK